MFITIDYHYERNYRSDLFLSRFELLQPVAPIKGGWRKRKPPATAKRVTHPLPKTPKRPR